MQTLNMANRLRKWRIQALQLSRFQNFYGGRVNKKDLPYSGVMLDTGLLSGYEDFTFKANGNTTRADW
ncbi:S-layer homology domain-containing protein [Lysinibacillus sp. M3]|uniref:S-layer homology domain-containing protein n=1 Tax=Lysinibacillus zambalensis TaxID=3160866 RepID=A0ABV1MLH0_9BACI